MVGERSEFESEVRDLVARVLSSVLDDTGSTANLQLLNHRYHWLRAQQARLITESNWSDEVTFPADLMTEAHDRDDADVRLIMTRQREEFSARRELQYPGFLGQQAVFELGHSALGSGTGH